MNNEPAHVLPVLPEFVPQNSAPNRHERRKSAAQARRLVRAADKAFIAYEKHMAEHGFAVSKAEFIESMP